jgi:hypothetical protein
MEAMASTFLHGTLAGLVVACCGCQPPTEISVVLTTNLACGEIAGTAVVVGTPSDVEGKDAATVTSACDQGRIGDIVLIPGKEREAAFVVKAVTGVGVLPEDCLVAETRPTDIPGQRGCIVARRELSFLPKTPLTLPIAMRRACIGVVCGAGKTCVEGGVCASATVKDPMRCADPGGCDETSLGVGSGGAGGAGTGGAGGANAGGANAGGANAGGASAGGAGP